ncbi:MAG: type II secretion system F family protein [Bryobacteraceae bacterium]
MELMATLLLFATVTAILSLIGSRFWVRQKAAIERVTRATSEAREMAHPSLAFHDLVRRLGALLPQNPKDTSAMQKRLMRAGYRGSGALKTFYGLKVALAALFGVAAFIVAANSDFTTNTRVMVLAGSVGAGLFAPNKWLQMRAKRRQRNIRRALPNALDLLVVCVESGLGLDQAIIQCAKELEHAHPEICQEFTLVNLELKAGKRRAEALRNLADRGGVDELKKLVAVLIQADKFGTSIAQSLRAHSDYLRVQMHQTAEEKAAKLGVKLIFPIFFCILPSLFVVTVGPVMVKISRELLPMMRDM